MAFHGDQSALKHVPQEVPLDFLSWHHSEYVLINERFVRSIPNVDAEGGRPGDEKLASSNPKLVRDSTFVRLIGFLLSVRFWMPNDRKPVVVPVFRLEGETVNEVHDIAECRGLHESIAFSSASPLAISSSSASMSAMISSGARCSISSWTISL